MFNSREYEWADVSLLMGGRDVTGIRGIKYSEKIEREAIYAKGRYPHSIQSGNVAYEGEITMLQSEYQALVLAGGGSVFNLTLNAVISYGNPSNGDVMLTDMVEHIRFTEAAKEFKQGDKSLEVTLPFVALRVKNQMQ